MFSATETEKNITYLTTSPKDIIETSNINTHSTSKYDYIILILDFILK